MDDDEFVLDENLKIRRMSEEEIKAFQTEFSPIDVKLSVGQSSFALKFEFEKEKFESKDGSNVIDTGIGDASNVVSAPLALLRLIGKGNVSIPAIRVEEIGERQPGLSGPAMQYCEISLFGEQYLVKKEDTSKIQNCWRVLSQLAPLFRRQENRDLLIASSRFHYSYIRKSWEDRIVDSMIGFEALVSREPDEATERESNRISSLIGEGDEQRIKIKKMFRKMYRLRSDIVHGRGIENPNNVREIPLFAQRLLAAAIRTALCLRNDGLSRENMIDMLNECLLSGEKREYLMQKKSGYREFISCEDLPFLAP
jgi:hypothetical protein